MLSPESTTTGLGKCRVSFGNACSIHRGWLVQIPTKRRARLSRQRARDTSCLSMLVDLFSLSIFYFLVSTLNSVTFDIVSPFCNTEQHSFIVPYFSRLSAFTMAVYLTPLYAPICHLCHGRHHIIYWLQTIIIYLKHHLTHFASRYRIVAIGIYEACVSYLNSWC